MDFKLPSLFTRQSGDIHNQSERLTSAADTEVADMASLMVVASETPGIELAGRMPDDDMTAVSAAVIAQIKPADMEMAARMADTGWDFN